MNAKPTSNGPTLEEFGTIAKLKNAAPAQIALAWLLAQKPGSKMQIVPIPGTTKLSRLEENVGSADIELTSADLEQIETASAKIAPEGARYPEALEKLTGR